MYLNFDVLYNTYKSKTIIDNTLIFPTIQALCTFNATTKTRGLYLIPVKSYNDLKTTYCAEKRAIYNTPTVHTKYSPKCVSITILIESIYIIVQHIVQ